MENFNSYNAVGQKTEAVVEALLKKASARYTRSELTAPLGTPEREAQMEAQHKGDFHLTASDVWIECKNDAMASKTGNVFFEVAEIKDENSQWSPRTIDLVGVLKSSMKARTIYVHQVGPEKYLVYSAEELTRQALMGTYSPFELKLKQDLKMGRPDKTNVGLLWKSFGTFDKRTLHIFAHIHVVPASGILGAIHEVYRGTHEYPLRTEEPLDALVRAFKDTPRWQKWAGYRLTLGGHPLGTRFMEDELLFEF